MTILIEFLSPSLPNVPTQVMLDMFKGIKDGSVPRYKGICRTMEEFIRSKYYQPLGCHWTIKWIKSYFESWNKFSGNTNYPVPGHGRQQPNNAYFTSTPESSWTGKYGQKRLALVDHIIARLEAKIAAHSMSKLKKFRAPDITYSTSCGDIYKGRADAILKRLEVIQAQQKTPLRKVASKKGICKMYRSMSGSPEPFVLKALFMSWPKYSGNDDYPVPSITNKLPVHDFYHEPRWTGKAGKLRRELLQHCIDVCKKRISEAKVKQDFSD